MSAYPYRWFTPIPDPRATRARRLRRLRRLMINRTREAAIFGAIAVLLSCGAAMLSRGMLTVVEPDESAHRFPDAPPRDVFEQHAYGRVLSALIDADGHTTVVVSSCE